MADLATVDPAVIGAYERLWPDAERIRRAAFRLGGRRRPRRPADYLGLDLLNGGRREVWAIADWLSPGPGAHLLELGCGIGGPSRAIADRHGCRVTGVDVSRRQLEIAAGLNVGLSCAHLVDLVRGDAQALPLASSTFTGVFSIEAFIHVHDKQAALAEAYRVLRAGGMLCIQDPIHRPNLPIAALEDTLHPIPRERFETLLREAGFVGVETRDRSAESRRCYEQLAWLIDRGRASPFRLVAALSTVHAGMRPSVWRLLRPTRFAHASAYLLDRSRGARELLETNERVCRVRAMCLDIVDGYRSGEIRLYQFRARKPPSTGDRA
jgi:SAM-dependent methyltransferase